MSNYMYFELDSPRFNYYVDGPVHNVVSMKKMFSCLAFKMIDGFRNPSNIDFTVFIEIQTHAEINIFDSHLLCGL